MREGVGRGEKRSRMWTGAGRTLAADSSHTTTAHLDGDHLVELQCPLLVEPDEAADAVVVRAVDTHLRHKHTPSGLWVHARVFKRMGDGCAS